MTWFKVDDGWARHPKTRKAGKDGRALWMTAGVECASAKTDGHVAAHLVRDYAYLADVNVKKAAAALVAAGLWHDSTTIRECRSCRHVAGELEPGSFYFHDWTDWQPTKDETLLPTDRLRWKRKAALKRDRLLCERIVERDRSRCRYCSIRVNWQDRRGPVGGTYDHVDPDGDNSLENVVVACRRCNGRKKDRTPEEAGMVLLDPPAPYVAGSGSELDPNQVETRSDQPAEPARDLAPYARHARDGTGQVGTRSGPGRDTPDPAGPGGPDRPQVPVVNGHLNGNGRADRSDHP